MISCNNIADSKDLQFDCVADALRKHRVINHLKRIFFLETV